MIAIYHNDSLTEEYVLVKIINEVDKVEKLRKIFYKGWAILCTVALIAGLSYLALGTPQVKKAVDQEEDTINYVLVNEDTGTTFNGKEYDLGKDFVDRINQDSEHLWQTETRSVAEAGFRSGAYDAVIMLPQDFSKKLLSLESQTPERAQITYKVSGGENALANAAVRQKVGQIINDFNQNIIQMYFSSVLNNLFEAQRNVATIVAGQEDTRTGLTRNVHDPFQNLPNSFHSVVDHTTNLAAANQNWQNQQNDFTEQTQELLTRAGEDMDGNLTQLLEYTQLQRDISAANLENGKLALLEQWESDTTSYKEMYDTFNTSVEGQLNAFYQESGDGDTANNTVMYGVDQAAQDFAQTQQEQIDRLTREIAVLTEHSEELLDLRNEVASTFFSDAELTPEDVTDDQIKTAILRMAEQLPEDPSKLPPVYFEELNKQIQGVAPDTLLAMAGKLYDHHLINWEQLQQYTRETSIVKRYAAEQGITLDAQQTFAFLQAEDTQYPQSQEYNGQMVSFDLDVDTSGRDTFRLKSDVQIEIKDLTALCQEMESQGQTFAQSQGCELHVEPSGASSFQVYFTANATPVTSPVTVPASAPVESSVSNPVPSGTPVPEEGTADSEGGVADSEEGTADSKEEIAESEKGTANPEEGTKVERVTSGEKFSGGTVSPLGHLQITVPVDIIWTFNQAEKQQPYNMGAYEWLKNGTTYTSGQLSAYVYLSGSDVQLKQDLSPLLSQMQRLHEGAKGIVTIYGDSTATGQTISDYYDLLMSEPGESLAALATPTSVYYRYGNMDDAEKKKLITDSLVTIFKAHGTRFYQELDAEYQALVSVIGSSEEGTSLTGTLHSLPAPDTLKQQANLLVNWAVNANQEIDQSYQQWRETTIHELEEQETSSPERSGSVLYYNQERGDQVYQYFEQLIQGSREQAASTGEAANKIESLESQFQQLNDETGGVQKETDQILTDVKDLAAQAQAQIEDNSTYSSNFNTVMANARTGGANNAAVFDFLSSPIVSTGTFGEVKTLSQVPYVMTLIGFLLALALGHGIRIGETRRRQRAKDRLQVPGSVWRNTPTALFTIVVAVAAGLFFSLFTRGHSEQQVAWMGYVGLLTMASVLFASFLFRQFPRMALYLLGGLFGCYLLLTPMLGITVTPGSWVAILFRISPLQNVENGYTALVGGAGVGWISYLVLVVLTGIGIALNFMVKSQVMKEKEPER